MVGPLKPIIGWAREGWTDKDDPKLGFLMELVIMNHISKYSKLSWKIDL